MDIFVFLKEIDFNKVILWYFLYVLLSHSLDKLIKIKGKTVGNLLSKFKSNINEFKINKRGIGQMLLLYLGLPLDSKLTDFDNGELKKNKTDKERELYDNNVYKNLTNKQIENKRERQKKYYNKIKLNA